MKARSILLVLLAVCLGCGQVSKNQDGSSGSPGNGAAGAADAGVSDAGDGIGEAGYGGAGGSGDLGGTVTAEPTWRLTNVEFTNTVHDLLGVTVTTPLEPDGAAAGYSAGLAAGSPTVLAYHTAAVQIAADALSTALQLVPCDADQISADPATCASKFIDVFAPKAFRRPIDAATKASMNDFFTLISAHFGFNSGIQALLEEVLQSPYFLYHLELEEQALGPGTVTVSGYSMASRLSYLIWASMPDDELFVHAAAGQLSTPAQIQAEALRMLDDPKAKLGLRNFYEQWLSVRALPSAKGGAFSSTYTAAQQASILASFRAQADAALWSDSAGLDTLLAGDQAFYDGNTTLLLGGPTVGGDTLLPMKMNPAQRLGILMHPAIMATLATDTASSPIQRGEFVWDRLLCQPLPPPPPNTPPFPGAASGVSVRQAYTTFDDASAVCAGCHGRIDPVGFLFENYDAVGAFRTLDDNGQTVDPAVSTVGIADSALDAPVANAVGFVKQLAAHHDQVSQCFATQLYRYAAKRAEGDGDQIFLSALAAKYVESGQSTKQLLSALTQSEAFLQRVNEN